MTSFLLEHCSYLGLQYLILISWASCGNEDEGDWRLGSSPLSFYVPQAAQKRELAAAVVNSNMSRSHCLALTASLFSLYVYIGVFYHVMQGLAPHSVYFVHLSRLNHHHATLIARDILKS